MKQILDTVRPDFRHYFTVRFFTGLRTGEVDGLQWKYVDFDNRLILVRETIVGGEEEYTKTDGSQRDIQMSQLVFDALQAQFEATGKLKQVRVLQPAGDAAGPQERHQPGVVPAAAAPQPQAAPARISAATPPRRCGSPAARR